MTATQTDSDPAQAVLNQPDPRGDIDLWRTDAVLARHAAGADGDLADHARLLGRAETRARARQADKHGPELQVFDRGGRRCDRVIFHPDYHWFLDVGLSAGYAARPWDRGATNGHLSHAAMVYLHSQAEPATCCPMTMTYAAVPALAGGPDLAGEWGAKLAARAYDPTDRPIGQKAAATLGMAMTERQGGSDVRANITRAAPADGHYILQGHKWFCSAPMSDGFLTLAQAPGGLTCFLVPRWLEGGDNAIRLMRLKDKLGNRANASAEIEYHGARAFRIGEEGEGVRRIIAMVHHTRLDTCIAPAGLMRAALSEAKHWCDHRTVFQRRLIDQPLMARVMADLTLDWAGATALGLHVARMFDAGEGAAARICVALAKYLNNKRCVPVVAEAMEVLGGMGYVADTPLPMLLREAPLNGIWEGSGNVICLDILRSLERPDSRDALMGELAAARGVLADFDTALADHLARWPGRVDEGDARLFCETTAGLLTASVLIRHGHPALAEGYAVARLVGTRGTIAGAVPGVDVDAVLAWL